MHKNAYMGPTINVVVNNCIFSAPTALSRLA